MRACPGEGDLWRLVQGELESADEAKILAHVEHCPACQTLVDRLRRSVTSVNRSENAETIACFMDDPSDVPAVEVAVTLADDPRRTIEVAERAADARVEDLSGTIEMDFGDGIVPTPAPMPSLNPSGTIEGIGTKTLLDSSVDPSAPDDSRKTVAIMDDRFTDPHSTLAVVDFPTAAAEGATISDAEATGSPPNDPFATIQPEMAPGLAIRGPTVPGYEILNRLGEGGMGVVYRARHRGLNRLVALKMIRGGAQARSDSFARFRVEAESVARLHHPNIIQIFDINEADGLPYVVLELLEGGSLQDRLAGDPQSGRNAAELLHAIALAVEFAHQSGIIHRDLKPSNILFSADGVPKITDFGLAKRVDGDDGQTLSGQVMGSPSYMAPEQARGDSRHVGPPADVHALGAILYEMLVGRVPYRAATVLETLRQVLDDDPVSPSRLVPKVPRDLETICLKCLQKDPARRYSSAGALAVDLKRYLDGEPIEARPIAGWERAWKWSRRRPVTAAAIVLGVLLTGGLIAGVLAEMDARLARSLVIAATLSDAPRLEGAAAEAHVASQITNARRRIVEFLPRLKGLENDPRIQELAARLETTLSQLDGRLADLQESQSAQERASAERERLGRFRERLNLALFQTLSISKEEAGGDPVAARREAVEALALYGKAGPGDDWAIGPIPDVLSPEEKNEVLEGCYELLLVLSKIEPTPESGLRRLAQATTLRPQPTRAYYLRKADCLERSGDAKGAEREHLAAVRCEVATPFDRYLAGQELYRRGDAVAALGQFASTLHDRPGHLGARCLSAICEFQLGHTEAARAIFTACLNLERDSPWLYILRGVASGLPTRASTPEDARAGAEMAEADFRRAAEILDRKPNIELRYILLVNHAVLDYRRKRYDDAASSLLQAIALDGRKFPAYATLAAVRRAQGKTREALEQFSRAIERRPQMAALYRGRAEAVVADLEATPADRSQALADLDRSIRLEGDKSRVVARDQVDRAEILRRENRLLEALAACDAAIARVPNYADAHRLRLDLLLRLKRHDEVLRSCDALIEAHQVTAGLFEQRAIARESLRDLPGAVDDFTTALAMGGDPAQLRRSRGWLYVVADAPTLALHDFEAVLRLDPSNADARVGRGLARLRLSQHREAVGDAEAALSLGDPGWELLIKSARIYALAARVVAAEARRGGFDSVRLSHRYQDRAVALLLASIHRTREEHLSDEIRKIIQTDRAFDAIRRRVMARGVVEMSTSPSTTSNGGSADKPPSSRN